MNKASLVLDEILKGNKDINITALGPSSPTHRVEVKPNTRWISCPIDELWQEIREVYNALNTKIAIQQIQLDNILE